MRKGCLIVTGAARGIGAATARLAAARGWPVCVAYRSSHDEATKVVRAIRADGGQAISVAGDVAVDADVIALFDRAEADLGPVAALVNNAGALAPAANMADMSLDRWNATLATNLTGQFLCAREAVRRMGRSRGGEGGAIVNVSSMAAVHGGAHAFIDYAAAKGGVDALTVGLAREVAADGIRVNAVRPGLIDTDIHAQSDPQRLDTLTATVPMRRVGDPVEVASAIVWLLSNEASYCTGTIIDVSGGR